MIFIAQIPKHLISLEESKYLLGQQLIHEKNKDNYGVRDKDLDKVIGLIKTKSLNEAKTSIEEINNRAYVMRAVTLIMVMIKQAETLNDKISLLSCINSLYSMAPDESIRLLSLLKSNME